MLTRLHLHVHIVGGGDRAVESPFLKRVLATQQTKADELCLELDLCEEELIEELAKLTSEYSSDIVHKLYC